MRKSDRLFQLTNILRSHQPITAKVLAEKLSVSQRTIYRYIDDLSVSGIPVYGEVGVGDRLADGFELPPLQLTKLEMEALVSGVQFIAAMTGKRLADPARSLLNKIEASADFKQAAFNTEQRVWFPYSKQESPEYRIWGEIHNAIDSSQWIDIRYQSVSDEVTNRVVYPLGIFYWGGKWTVTSWCQLRNDYRDFRVDRIQSLQTIIDIDPPPSHVTLDEYLDIKKSILP